MDRAERQPCSHQCRLCGSVGTSETFHKDKYRTYYKCSSCNAIFVPDEDVLPAMEEKAEYDLHDNFNEDEGYRRFLSRTADVVVEHFASVESKSELTGFDFGCGPNPLLAKMLSTELLHCQVDYHDKYYHPENSPSSGTGVEAYDFITATEVFEHLQKPLQDSLALWRMLKPAGILVIMTKRASGAVADFKNWHYIRDRTHIVFFSEPTFRWLANNLREHSGYSCDVSFPTKDVAVLTKLPLEQ